MKYLCFAFALLAACGSESDEQPLGNESGLSSGMPCEVQSIVDKYCSSCHGATPAAGAPMSLTSQAAFQGNALNGEVVYQRVLEKLHDPAAPMPPAAGPQPSAAELQTLTDWLNAKAPSSSASCSVAPDAGTDQFVQPAIPDSECEVIIELHAHGAQTLPDTAGFQPPQVDDHYECFHFPVPWMQKMQVLKIEPLIGDQRVLHHFLLYQDPKKVQKDGAHEECLGVHPDSALLTGWAPGGQGVSLPPDVGLQVAQGPDAQFNLEVHYNNLPRYTDVNDNSGVRICATSKLRKNEATAHWLGTEVILLPPGKETTTGGECNPKQTSHIISVSPHMHKTGRHMSTLIARANGTMETLIDKPFDFNDQRVYPVGGAAGEVIVGPGDKLTTRCTYQNDSSKFITFGESTGSEMCYNFVVAWPAGSLATGGLLTGPNRCQQ